MDLLGAESRKSGTRGGRGDFTWGSVKHDERQYYLGNSVSMRPTGRRPTSQPDFDWYTKPSSASASVSASASASAPTDPPPSASAPTTATAASTPANDLQAVRRKEKAIMEQMIVGHSFSDAVRSALAESVGDGVDDEGTRGDAAAAAARRAVLKRREKTEKAQRKEMRRRVREMRRVRRAERHKGRDRHHEAAVQQRDSTESERDCLRSRLHEDASRRIRTTQTIIVPQGGSV